jgi:hypothetical protein
VLSRPDELERLARQAETVVARYSISSATDRMLAVYQQVLSEAGSGSK